VVVVGRSRRIDQKAKLPAKTVGVVLARVLWEMQCHHWEGPVHLDWRVECWKRE
jgi:hypothetical protein